MGKVLDVEIEMHVFRLLRSGHFKKATDILRELKADFPEETEGRLIACCKSLAGRLLAHTPH